MNFEDFTYRAKQATQEYLGAEAQLEIEKITKNNGLVLTALLLRESEGRVTPTVYLEQYYEAYSRGKSFGEVMEMIFSVYDQYGGVQFDLDFFSDYQRIKKRLLFKLIHFEKNKDMLQGTPFIPWEDLAIVFFVLFDNDVLGRGTILIKREHMEKWNVSVEEMYRDAMENMPRLLEADIISMRQLLNEVGISNPFSNEEEADEFDMPMYILTNKQRMYGASTLIYSDKLSELAKEFDTNLYVIPSSVHELILMPDCGKIDAEYIKGLIHTVNSSQVAPDEVLSDELYYYDKTLDRIAMYS